MKSSNLAPIRIEIETEGYKFRDVFCWNIEDTSVNVESFVDIICRDFDLPVALFRQPMLASINEQLQDYLAFQRVYDSIRLDAFKVPIYAILRLHIIIDYTQYFDMFLWNVVGSDENPEVFAEWTCSELGLSQDFQTAVAHAIREQVFWLRKALVSFDYKGGENEDVPLDLAGAVRPFAECVAPVFREGGQYRPLRELEDFTPRVRLLTAEELDKLEYGAERNSRRIKRFLKTKRSLETWSFTSPPKLLRTSLSYRGSVHRVLVNDNDDEEDRYMRRARSDAESRHPQWYKESLACSRCQKDTILAYLTYFHGAPLCVSCRPYYEFGSDISLPLYSEDTLSLIEAKGMIQPAFTPKAPKEPKKIYPRQIIEAEPLTAKERAKVPEWLWKAREKMLKKYRNDFFSIVFEHGDLKLKCYDCAKTYQLGPSMTINNYEIHITNRSHRQLVSKRITEFRKSLPPEAVMVQGMEDKADTAADEG